GRSRAPRTPARGRGVRDAATASPRRQYRAAALAHQPTVLQTCVYYARQRSHHEGDAPLGRGRTRIQSGAMLTGLLGGALIGLAATLYWIATGRTAGVSGILSGALGRDPEARGERVAFLGGLVGVGLLTAL